MEVEHYVEQERQLLLLQHVDSTSSRSHCCGVFSTENAYNLDYRVRMWFLPVFMVMNVVRQHPTTA